jgi:hypothetical protein
MAQYGPIVPSLCTNKTNVHSHTAAAAPDTYYGGSSSSLSPISFPSASPNSSLPPTLSSNNDANPPYFRSSDEYLFRAQYTPQTRDRQHNYKVGELQENNFGEGDPRGGENGGGGRLKHPSSPIVSNSSTTSSSSSPHMLSQTGSATFTPGESSISPRSERPVTASSHSPVLMTRMDPHTRLLMPNHPVTSTHPHGMKSTFVPVPGPTAYHGDENEDVRGCDNNGHRSGQDEFERRHYASGDRPVYDQQQPLPLPLAAPALALAPDAHAHIHLPPSSRLFLTASSDWASLSAQGPHAQQQEIVAQGPPESTADSRSAYSYRDHHTQTQW